VHDGPALGYRWTGKNLVAGKHKRRGRAREPTPRYEKVVDRCSPVLPNGSRLSCGRARTTLAPTAGRRREKQETRRPEDDRAARHRPRPSAAAAC
jgi:hypothetical protein